MRTTVGGLRSGDEAAILKRKPDLGAGGSGHGIFGGNELSQQVASNIEWDRSARILRRSLEAGGAFLLTQTPDGRTNPMTIGWAQIGIIWGRPVCTVFVRKSRHTYGCITAASEFAVSVPGDDSFRKELAVCGSVSGRDADKVRDLHLNLMDGSAIDTAVINGCDLQIECRILASTQMLPDDLLSNDVRSSYYPAGDEHLVVFGEIIALYEAVTDSAAKKVPSDE